MCVALPCFSDPQSRVGRLATKRSSQSGLPSPCALFDTTVGKSVEWDTQGSSCHDVVICIVR
jgi:hypothetical protein